MVQKYRFGAVIPAAGLSSRMGAFKPLLPLCCGTVIEAAIGSVMPFACTATAVVGYRAEELREALSLRFGERLTIVENPDYAATDMLRSVQLGLQALDACDAFYLLPADMPLIAPIVFETLAEHFDDSCDVIYPVFDGRRGHPPLISVRLIPAIQSFGGDGGLRAILRDRTTKSVAISDSGILTDLDTPEDYQRINPYRT